MIGFFVHINYVAVLIAAAISFFIGYVWFSVLFKEAWRKELKESGISVKEPAKEELYKKLAWNFVADFVTALGMIHLVNATDSFTAQSGLHLGLLVAIFFVAPTLACGVLWENRSTRLYLIDVAYHAVSLSAVAIFLSVWQ